MNTKAFENSFMEKVMEDEAWKDLSGNFPWTEKMLEKYQDKVDWAEVSGNWHIIWTPSMLDKFKRRIAQQVFDILFGTGEKVVGADYIVSILNKTVA